MFSISSSFFRVEFPMKNERTTQIMPMVSKIISISTNEQPPGKDYFVPIVSYASSECNLKLSSLHTRVI